MRLYAELIGPLSLRVCSAFCGHGTVKENYRVTVAVERHQLIVQLERALHRGALVHRQRETGSLGIRDPFDGDQAAQG